MSDAYCYKVRVGVVLIHDQKILLVRQNNKPFWVFPGGTLEMDESLTECAVRELQEEVNLGVSIEKELYLADFLHQGKDGQPRHTVDVFMLARYETGTPMMTVDENLNEMGFFTLEEFREMAVQPRVVADRVLVDWPKHFLDANGLALGTYGTVSTHP